MKVQIDAIVAKSDALKSESNSEQYNSQLTDNGIYTVVSSSHFVTKYHILNKRPK